MTVIRPATAPLVSGARFRESKAGNVRENIPAPFWSDFVCAGFAQWERGMDNG